jgi:uncharacterized membrane protein (UPF0182 family)
MIPQRRPAVSKRAIVIIALIVILALLFGSARFYTDVLWFNEVGFSSVLWKSLRTQFLVGLAVGLFTAAVVWVNLYLAARFAPPFGTIRIDITGKRPDGLDQARMTLAPYMSWIRLGISVLIGFLAGISGSSAWQLYLLWAHKGPFGIDDPQFGKDLGFYVFELPFLERVAGLVWFAIIAALLLTIALQYFNGSIRPELGLRGVTPSALAHISVLLGLLALVKAYQYYLGTFSLNFSERGVVTGAGYTDVHAQLPALRLLAIISILSAILFLVNIRVRRLALPLAAVGIWILTAFLAGTVWPQVVQRFSVDPQEPQRERPYIERNLAATRAAFGLNEVDTQEYPALVDLSGDDIAANEALLQNVRLWDPAVLQRAYQQLQALRTYYQFTDVDVDRYIVDGQMRQVLLSTRELSLDDIPERSKTWQNLHLQYTHGFGLVSSLANESTTAGAPSFLVRDVPGTVTAGAESFDTDQPRIYYGEGFQANEYSIVNSDQEELDYPLEEGETEGTSAARNSYDGEGGIEVGNIFKRLAFAVREGDPNLVLSGLINPDSKILIYRNLRDRVRRAAPFLSLDNDPYPVVADGRIVWVLDAYTSTRWFPYSERVNASDFVRRGESGVLSGTMNYVRNSVKVTVDAYDGTMKFYVIDEEDPLIVAWRDAFPDLFTDEEPSDDLRAHFRYPEDLFSVQSEVFRTYHMTDAQDFYLKEDEWDVPAPPVVQGFETTSEGQFLSPTYLLLELPGETTEEFVLTRPFTPRNRPTMVSTMLARSDPANYGEITVLEFPRVRTVLGPQQVDNLINNDTEIAPTLTLLRQRGSTVQFGSLVILPIEESLLYVQPIFVTASAADETAQGIPELKYVALVLGEKVVMEENFDLALASLLDLEEPTVPGVEPTPGPTPSPGASPTETPSPEPPAGDQELQELIEEAGRIYDRAQEALADGDFEEYARLIEKLGRLLSQAQT